MAKYKALIIGAGSIGALKLIKFDSPTSNNILTHSNSIYRNQNIDLIEIIDTNPQKQKEATLRWNPTHEVVDPDIIVVSTPTDTHFKVLSDVIQTIRPKIIVAEKPVCSDKNQCEKILALAKEFNIPLIVNYIRRFEPKHQELKKAFHFIAKREGIYSVRFLYGRGTMHDGCHGIDLCHWWFGDMLASWTTSIMIDQGNKQETHRFVAEFQKCPQVIFSAVDSEKVGIFEMDIITDIGRYILKNNGTYVQIFPIKKGDDWGDYPVLSDRPEKYATDLLHSLPLLYENITRFLEGKEDLKCTGQDALKVWKTYERINK